MRARAAAAESIMQTVSVDLGDRTYPIYIGPGLLEQPELLKKHIRGKRVLIVTNETIAPLYLERCEPRVPHAALCIGTAVPGLYDSLHCPRTSCNAGFQKRSTANCKWILSCSEMASSTRAQASSRKCGTRHCRYASTEVRTPGAGALYNPEASHTRRTASSLHCTATWLVSPEAMLQLHPRLAACREHLRCTGRRCDRRHDGLCSVCLPARSGLCASAHNGDGAGRLVSGWQDRGQSSSRQKHDWSLLSAAGCGHRHYHPRHCAPRLSLPCMRPAPVAAHAPLCILPCPPVPATHWQSGKEQRPLVFCHSFGKWYICQENTLHQMATVDLWAFRCH
jgi:hypothetical protein